MATVREGERTCTACHRTFTYRTVGRGRIRRTCSEECAKAEAAARREVQRAGTQCEFEGCLRLCRSGSSAFCETHYYRQRRHGDPRYTANRQARGTCYQCGEPVTGRVLFCSDQCRRRDRLSLEGPAFSCVTCSGPIQRPWATVYCSETCQVTGERGRRYKLTPAEMHARMVASDGRCECCGRGNCELVVDHDHDGGDVRGLLCTQCNVGIGMFADNPARLRAAATYLERFDGLEQPSTEEPAPIELVAASA